MAEATGYVLPLGVARIERLRWAVEVDGRFAEPVEEFKHSRGAPLLCFIVNSSGEVLFLAQGRRGVRAGTDLRRLNLDDFHRMTVPISLPAVAGEVPARFRKRTLDRVSLGGLLTVNQFTALVDVIVAQNGELGELLRRYSTVRKRAVEAIGPQALEQLAFQKEAVMTALTISGLDREPLRTWEPDGEGVPESFLHGLASVRLREDAMLANDLQVFPGFDRIAGHISGGVLFQDGRGKSLSVLLANRQPLEALTGADLIYVNESYRSFVFVQYKAMDKEEEGEALFRIPDAQLTEELKRMDEVLSAIEEVAQVDDVDGFRLNWNPFFLKFCARIVFNPDDVGLTPGMYIPRDKWPLLEVSPKLRGKKGGLAIAYDRVDRYLDNTAFAALVGGAWVGTTPSQTSMLERVVRQTLEEGRAAVIAVHREAEVV